LLKGNYWHVSRIAFVMVNRADLAWIHVAERNRFLTVGPAERVVEFLSVSAAAPNAESLNAIEKTPLQCSSTNRNQCSAMDAFAHAVWMMSIDEQRLVDFDEFAVVICTKK
jgi:hypothetical protein